MSASVDPAVVWALHTTDAIDTINLRLVELDSHGLLGLSEENGRTTAWFPARIPGLDGDWERVRAHGWDEAWRAAIEPVTAGPFVVTPPWKATGSTGEIVIEPAQAFGTGHHETTTGCLVALAALDVVGRRVLDVGTGTGVLAIAAAKLGAAEVVACDTDAIAVTTARQNALNNGVSAEAGAGGAVTVVSGSLDAIPPGTFDAVVANLTTSTVTCMAGHLVARCSGHLVVSGVSRLRAPEAVTALRNAGVEPVVNEAVEWVVLTADRT